MNNNPVPLTEFRENMTEFLNEKVARNGERLVITRNGEPFAVVMDIDEYEDLLELQDSYIQAMIRESNADVAAGRLYPAEKLLSEVRDIANKVRQGKKKSK